MSRDEKTKPQTEVCPSCQAADNKPYVDANGVAMRACGRCMIQWRESVEPPKPSAPQAPPQAAPNSLAAIRGSDGSHGVAPQAEAPTQHQISEVEERNAWTYIHCSCGWESGPFSNRDYAHDHFEMHAGGSPEGASDGTRSAMSGSGMGETMSHEINDPRKLNPEKSPQRMQETITDSILEEMPDAFGRMGIIAGIKEWCRQWGLLIEERRKEAQLACDLRVTQDQVIERCAKAVEKWPEAAAILRAHVDGISGEDWGGLNRELTALRERVAEAPRPSAPTACEICGASGVSTHYVDALGNMHHPRQEDLLAGSTVHAAGCECGFCKMGGTKGRVPLIQWLEERRENCLRIAISKTGEERGGWLEDAEYFGQCLSRVAESHPTGIPIGVALQTPTPTQPKQTLCSHGVLPEWCDSCAHTFHGCLISDMMAWIDALGEKTETIYGGSKLHARHDPRCDVYLQQPCNCGLVGEAEAPRGDQFALAQVLDFVSNAQTISLRYGDEKTATEFAKLRERLEANSAPSVDIEQQFKELAFYYFPRDWSNIAGVDRNEANRDHCRAALREMASRWPLNDISSRAQTVCDMCDAYLDGSARPDEAWKALLRGNINGLRSVLQAQTKEKE